MSSTQTKRTYECFECKRLGVKGIQIILGGRDAQNKTIYLEPDGKTAHHHKAQQQQLQEQAPSISKQEFQDLKSDIAEIKEMLKRYQTIYGDMVEFMHKLTITQQQEREKNEQLAEQEARYDRDKEDGII